jgi:hypothetical protein
MRNSEFWLSAETRSDRGRQRAGVGPVRVALLFGTIAVAMALLLPPVAQSFDATPRIYAAGNFDMMPTGSIPQSVTRIYTERRSILQEPGSVCIISPAGVSFGGC